MTEKSTAPASAGAFSWGLTAVVMLGYGGRSSRVRSASCPQFQQTLPAKTCISAGCCGRELKLVAIPKDEGEAGGNLRQAKAPNTTKQVKIGFMALAEPVIGNSF